MLTAIDPQTRVRVFFPPGDPEPSVFTIRPLTVSEMLGLRTDQADYGKRAREIVRLGVVGWENYDPPANGDDSGADITEGLPYAPFLELHNRINEISGMSDELVGNSESPSPTA